MSLFSANAEKNYTDLCRKIPWAKRVHGVEGSDAAHKACAELSETSRFITIDGDNIVHSEFVNQSVEFATKSLRISIKSYITFLKNPNLKNATEMSIASNLAGKAISISKTTAPHAASYPFTSLLNISHGHAVGLFFERFFKFN